MNMKRIEIKNSSIEGRGIFATEKIKKGGFIQYIAGQRIRKLPKTKEEALSIPNWFGLSRQLWIDPGKGTFRFLNHSCEPNAAIKGTKTLVALQDIEPGQEITVDYSITDADPLWEMDCLCKTKTCRQKIGAIHTVPPTVFKRHMPFIPRYFQRVYIRNYIHSMLKSEHGKRTQKSGQS
jgi:uncharacterized protein